MLLGPVAYVEMMDDIFCVVDDGVGVGVGVGVDFFFLLSPSLSFPRPFPLSFLVLLQTFTSPYSSFSP